jgi:hypothetical protein
VHRPATFLVLANFGEPLHAKVAEFFFHALGCIEGRREATVLLPNV